MKKILKIISLLTVFVSCSSDLDLEQVNEIQFQPTVVANLASFELRANQFVVGGVEQPYIGDVMDFTLFNDVDFYNSIRRTDFYFEFNNTINRALVVTVLLLDSNNARLYTIPISIPAYTGTTNSITKTEIFENSNLDILNRTKKIAFIVTPASGLPLTANSVGNLKFRSSGTIYFEIE